MLTDMLQVFFTHVVLLQKSFYMRVGGGRVVVFHLKHAFLYHVVEVITVLCLISEFPVILFKLQVFLMTLLLLLCERSALIVWRPEHRREECLADAFIVSIINVLQNQ